jgi:glucose-6-phosphate isomerase
VSTGAPGATWQHARAPAVTVQTRSIAVSEATAQALGKLAGDGVPGELAAGDATLWGSAAEPEASIRLGWLQAPQFSRELLPEIGELAERSHADGLDHLVLAGMGGSSLAPEVITKTSGVPLTILDTTDPHQVARVLGDRLGRTLVVVSSKSGTTIETDSHRRIYEQAFAAEGISGDDLRRRFIVVTDPGSPLEDSARDAGYHVVQADPYVGGRYSALTAFGLVPAGLAGADVSRLLDDAEDSLAELSDVDGNPGLTLGAALGGYALAGHDKAVLAAADPAITGFGDWAEQLIAESTGKEGRGILPVVVDSDDSPGFSPGPDVHLIGLGEPRRPVDTSVRGPLGAQFLVWEYAVAVAGRLLGINPFDQPDVAESKENTSALLAEAGSGPLPTGQPAFVDGAVEVHAEPDLLRDVTDLPGVFDALLWSPPQGGYLAIMAYLDRVGDGAAARLRDALAARTTHPVTFGWAPRVLHSTGQYHKGGPRTGVFLQITGAVQRDVEVPGQPFTLGRLQLAQALGDLGALRERGLPIVRLHLHDRASGLAQLLAAASTSATGAYA